LKAIGIDPDLKRPGFAVWDGALTVKEIEITELIEILGNTDLTDYKIRIEAGWLNFGNWHIQKAKTKEEAAEIGRRTGENHAAGKILAMLCGAYCNDVELVRPTTKKLTKAQFKSLTGLDIASQDARDAGRLILDLRG